MRNLLCMGSRARALLFFTFTLHFTMLFCVTFNGTLRQGQVFMRGDELLSESGKWSLKFHHGLTPGQYLGLDSYGGTIWLANRNNPIDEAHSRPSLLIDDSGNLKLYDGDSQFMVIYSSESAHNINASVILHNNGNMILYEIDANGSIKRILWQSFDYPVNILVPGMRLGINWKTGQQWTLTSILGDTYAVGSFTFGMDPNHTEQLVIRWQGNIYWTSGPQNESGSFPNLSLDTPGQYIDYFRYVSNENETYFYFNSSPNSNYTPQYNEISLDDNGGLTGFVDLTCPDHIPKNPNSGCVPQKLPACRNPDTLRTIFRDISLSKSQEGYVSADAGNFSLYYCGILCLNNCSCAAYAPAATNNKTGCEMWSSEANFVYADESGWTINFLEDIHKTTIVNPPDNPPDYPSANIKERDPKVNRWWIWLLVGVGSALAMPLIFFLCRALWRKYKTEEGIHKIWENPNEFWPERFIGKDIDVRGHDYELLPFGSGRRMCPGYPLGLKVIQSSLANLLHGFHWRLPDDMKKEDLNMEEIFGLSNPKKFPLEVIAKSRLPSHLYEL